MHAGSLWEKQTFEDFIIIFTIKMTIVNIGYPFMSKSE